MTGLVEWLEAQIAEDEQVARGGRPWLDVDGQRIEDDLGHVFAYVSEPQVREHIARWDPARVLAECNAKRRIIEAHSGEHYCPMPVVTGEHGQLWTELEGPCWTLRLLSEPYANRPRYEEARRIPDDDE